MHPSFLFLKWTTRISAALLAAFMLVAFFVSSASAAGWSTEVVSLTDGGELAMAPGERTTVTATFKNTGSAAWYNDGWAYISAYTHGPKYRSSLFDPGTWEWGDHPARISDLAVRPGEQTTVSFELRAPQQAGLYKETFHLAAEEVAWVSGGEFTFTIRVDEDHKMSEIEPPAQVVKGSDGLSAELVVKSANKITTTAGRPILFTAGFKNTGDETWHSVGLMNPGVSIANGSSDFSHPSWNGGRIAYSEQSVAPGELAVVSFSMTAPSSNGVHWAKFQLQANGSDVSDAFVEIPVEVTGGTGEVINAPKREAVANEALDTVTYLEEPTVRIGFLIVDEETDNEVVITSVYSDFHVSDTEGNLLAEMKKGETVTAFYSGGHYYYDVGRGVETSSYGLRFKPVEDHAIMRVANFDRRLTRNAKYADNEFRGILELRHNDYKDRTWLINELSVEHYLRGLAETSDVSPLEYQKALITAARTYVFYHFTHATKYKNEFFHISSYSWDQVYNGYGQEKRAPNISKAVQATRGMVVTYNDELAITPYFSRSDGRTRDFGEVWNGSRAWLVSVPVACDVGRTLWGHGVGMSASGALCMAKQGQNWEQILTHFYTGIDLAKKWK